MNRIILLVLSKIYYITCNRKAQVFLRILYIVPYNIRTQKNRAAAEATALFTFVIVSED